MEIQLWREILNPYELAVREIMTKFNHLIKEHRDRGLYSPIEQVEGRVKTISSILEKCQKKKIDLEDIEERIYDLAGVRVICQFVEDIDKVVELDPEPEGYGDQAGAGLYPPDEEQRLPQLPYDHLLYGRYPGRPEKAPGGAPDPDHGHEFLGHCGALPAVQV